MVGLRVVGALKQASGGEGLDTSNSSSQLPDYWHCWGTQMRPSCCGCSMEGVSYRQECRPGQTCVSWCRYHRAVDRPSRQVG